MDNIKRLNLPIEAGDFLDHIEIPKLLIYCEEKSQGYYEVDEIYAPKILRRLESMRMIEYPSIEHFKAETEYWDQLPF